MSLILDCGDHDCLFAKDKSGMRTNGGCRCLKDIDSILQRGIRQEILSLRTRLATYEAALVGIIDQIDNTRRITPRPNLLGLKKIASDALAGKSTIAEKIEKLKTGIRSLQWDAGCVGYPCVACKGNMDIGHNSDCWIKKLLEE
jgi:hypothetical protein